MMAYSVRYRINRPGFAGSTPELIDAKSRESAVRKLKRKLVKRWRIAEDEIEVLTVGIIGYY